MPHILLNASQKLSVSSISDSIITEVVFAAVTVPDGVTAADLSSLLKARRRLRGFSDRQLRR